MPLPSPEPDPISGAAAGGRVDDNSSPNGHDHALTVVERPQYRWYHKLAGVMAAIFCFELGVFLLVFPWASDWDVSYFAFLPLGARTVWVSPYFRGAISGLGILNIYISFLEVFRLRRFSA
jgi:hypothetical protein